MSAGRMALEKLGAVREIQTRSGTLFVGPILDRDRLSFREKAAGRMALEKVGAVREIQTRSGTLFVGPILDRDRLSFREKGVCRAAEGVFHGPAASSKGLECGVTSNSRVSSSRPQESSLRGVQSVGVKSSPFYFGSGNAVIERDENGSKVWIRLQNSLTHEVEWVQL